ncbi:hypothetical protein VPHK479_0103 [Vibrio phage K479]
MDKYDFQEVLKANGFKYYQGGGIYHKGGDGGTVGIYKPKYGSRVILSVLTNNSKLKTICLLHGILTEPYA